MGGVGSLGQLMALRYTTGRPAGGREVLASALSLHPTWYGGLLLLAGAVLSEVGAEYFHHNTQGCVFLRCGVCLAAAGALMVHHTAGRGGDVAPILLMAGTTAAVVAAGFLWSLHRITAAWDTIHPRVWAAVPDLAQTYRWKVALLRALSALVAAHLILVVWLCATAPTRAPKRPASPAHASRESRFSRAFALAAGFPAALYLLCGAVRDASVVPFKVQAVDAWSRVDALLNIAVAFFAASSYALVKLRQAGV